MFLILRDGERVRRERVLAEIDCPYSRCGALAGGACIGRRGPRQVELHQARWMAWAAKYRHVIKYELPVRREDLPPRVAEEVERRLGPQRVFTELPSGSWQVGVVGTEVWPEEPAWRPSYDADSMPVVPDFSHLLEM